jgi:hypothetical protein
MLEDLFDDLLILDEGDDFHPPLALQAVQGVDLIDFLNQSGPVYPVLLGPSSDSTMQGMTSSRFNLLLFPWETLL